MYAEGTRGNTGSPSGDCSRDQLGTRERQAGPCGVTQRSVVPERPGNSGGGKGPQLNTNARSDKGRGSGDEPNNPNQCSEVGKQRRLEVPAIRDRAGGNGGSFGSRTHIRVRSAAGTVRLSARPQRTGSRTARPQADQYWPRRIRRRSWMREICQSGSMSGNRKQNQAKPE